MKVSRLATITKVFLEEGLGFLTERKPERSPEQQDESAEQPSGTEFGKRLRRTLERLGPTFVKFGQLLGTRVDLFDEEILAELGQLHSHVPPFPNDVAREILETELGAGIDEVFAELSADPIAAASIAQVYKGRLAGADGGWVAVKVQRPGLDESLISDLEVLVEVSGFIDALVPPYRRSMIHRVAEEYAHRALKEIDFTAEAQAIEEFSDVLTTLPEFRAPRVYRELCTSKVLVMEWFEGTKLDTIETREQLAAQGVDPDGFGRAMLRLQISMSYEHGFVHGDTHPGNIILLPGGHIGLIDFGLNAHIPRALREKLLETLFFQASGRIDEAVAAYVTVLDPDPSVDRAALEADLKRVLSVRAGAVSSMRDNRVTAQLIAGLRVGSRYHIKARSELFIVVRNLTIVEGIILRYSPGLDPAVELRTITGAILRRKLFGPSMLEDMAQLVPQIIFTLSKRPQLIERLLGLERAFVEAKTLGAFLRQQQVLASPAPPRGFSASTLALIGLLGLALGAVLHALLG